jgi:hypothetical protein
VIGKPGVDPAEYQSATMRVIDSTEHFVALFENNHVGEGDGIRIRLGKPRTENGVPPAPSPLDVVPESLVATYQILLECGVDDDAKIDALGEIFETQVEETALLIAGLAVGTGNIILDYINQGLDVIDIPQTDILLEILTEINGGPPSEGVCANGGDCMVPDELIDPESDFYLGGLVVLPALFVPDIQIDAAALGVEAINLLDLDFWGIPALCFDTTPTVLNNDNEFIRFEDSDKSRMGSIRAVSNADFALDVLNPVYLKSLHGAWTTSKLDPEHAQYTWRGKMVDLASRYYNIGVEYSSGNGDYAEWLERSEPGEWISPGDIVGVVGGKISRDLENCEQVMVVSHHPIVLGNVPEEGKTHLGNNVAFMGQVPVNVMGKVHSGDYIVASKTIPGYGVAIDPSDMEVEDFKYAVGRSWDSIDTEGPNMVNTVVGIHNGDYLKVLKKFEDNIQSSEKRLESLEEQVEAINNVLRTESIGN